MEKLKQRVAIVVTIIFWKETSKSYVLLSLSKRAFNILDCYSFSDNQSRVVLSS